jgi:hypothetical protein
MPKGKDSGQHGRRQVSRDGLANWNSQQSGRGMYKIHGDDGGGYLRTTPTEGSDDRHDVTYYSDDHKPQYSVSGARFHHDPEKNEASFGSGKDTGSGEFMKHVWRGKTFGGNTHQDDTP